MAGGTRPPRENCRMMRMVTIAMLAAALLPAGHAFAQKPFPKTPPGANELPPGHPPVDNSPTKKPIRDLLRYGRPLGCWSSFNGYGCSSFHSTAAFVFGSCRTFYGEPCLKGAPPSPLPPWAGNEGGYRRVGTDGFAGPGGPGTADGQPAGAAPAEGRKILCRKRCTSCDK